MLKKISKLLLGLMVCTGSACVTPTHASSASSVVISHIQAGGAGGAKDELIVLHNNTPVAVEVTNWCLVNKHAENITCLNSQGQKYNTSDTTQEGNTPTFRYILPAYGDITIASAGHVAQSGYLPDAFSFVYTVSNQSSGSIVRSADTITLVNGNKEIIDQKSWSSPLPAGKILVRVIVIPLPVIYAAMGDASDWGIASQGIFIPDTLEVKVDTAQPENPDNPHPPADDVAEDDGGGDGAGEAVDGDSGGEEEAGATEETLPLILTELLPNAKGVDAGNEFIEFYNPNEYTPVSLAGLQLRVGLSLAKWHLLPDDVVVQPRQYVALYNSEVAFSLVNTSGGVQLFQGDVPLGYRIEYMQPKDDHSWSLIEGVWQYTAVATPGAVNVPTPLTVQKQASTSDNTPKPCAENQFRNPETGRCKLLPAAVSAPAPCKPGQERNSKTNRCRTIAAASAAPAPCKEGQERNPETNRCRKIIKMTNADYKVLGVTAKAGNQPGWYVIVTIGLVVAGVLAYAIWEWRQEMTLGWRRVCQLFAKRNR